MWQSISMANNEIEVIRPTACDRLPRERKVTQALRKPDYKLQCKRSNGHLAVVATHHGYVVYYMEPVTGAYNAAMGRFLNSDYICMAQEQGHTASALCREYAVAFAQAVSEIV